MATARSRNLLLLAVTSKHPVLRRCAGVAIPATVVFAAFAASWNVGADVSGGGVSFGSFNGIDADRFQATPPLASAGDGALRDAADLFRNDARDGRNIRIPTLIDGVRETREADLAALEKPEATTPEVGDKNTELACLTEAIYFEGRGESSAGQAAIAEVILNRVDSSSYPDLICDVVRQGENNGRLCQFSYRCDGKSETMFNPRAQKRANDVARAVLRGKLRNFTDRATHYHAVNVRPYWARKLVKTARIGNHIFYRKPIRLSSR